jgi:hypothetical protein
MGVSPIQLLIFSESYDEVLFYPICLSVLLRVSCHWCLVLSNSFWIDSGLIGFWVIGSFFCSVVVSWSNGGFNYLPVPVFIKKDR